MKSSGGVIMETPGGANEYTFEFDSLVKFFAPF